MYVRSLLVAVATAASFTQAGLIDTVVDTTPGGPTVNTPAGSVGVGEYVGTVSGGGGGFGGPVGGATLSVDSDANGIYLGLSNLGNISGNSIRVYFDTKSGGFTELSSAAGFNDNQDFGRSRISRPASSSLTLPFAADYGLIISDAFDGFQALFELQTGGNGSLVAANTGNVYSDPNSDNAGGTDASIETFITYSNLGISPGDAVDFILVYANNNDPGDAFLSNESFPQQFPSNPGATGVATDFHRLVTIPEPASLGVAGIVGLLAGRRRRR